MLIELINGEVSQSEVLAYYNATISYEDLPFYIEGFVFNYNGIYNIFINKYLSYQKRKMVILHELAHVELNQLCQADSDLFAFYIDHYEDEVDKYVKSLKERLVNYETM